MKRWKSILEEDYALIYKPGSTNVVANALSSYPVSLNTTTIHFSAEDDSKLIMTTEAPINSFKNQIFITLDKNNEYLHEQPFLGVHRHKIKIKDLNRKTFAQVIQNYFHASVINGIFCSE